MSDTVLRNNRVMLGDKVKDRITGFEGIVTARTEFLYGCVRVNVTRQNKVDKEGKEIIFFTDELAVDVLEENAVVNLGPRIDEQGGPSRFDGANTRADVRR